MPTYTVHQPPLREGKAVSGPERFVFVRDGFHFWAFVLPPVWLLLRGLWMVLVLYVIASAVLGVVLYTASTPAGARVAIGLFTSLLVGLEATTVWRWTLARRGWTQIGFVVAEDDEEAERRFFSQWTAKQPAATQPAAPLVTPVSQQPAYPLPMSRNTLPQKNFPDVIGSFPQPGASR